MSRSSANTNQNTVIPSEAEGSGRISPLRVATRNASVEMTAIDDRLAHAKIFAAKLSDSRLREMAKTYRERWTPAARAEKAKIIQIVKPWTRATGPKSGPKAKGAGYPMIAMKRALRDHALFLRFAAHWPDMTEKGRKLCLEAGQAATWGILTALAISWCVTDRNNE